MFSRALTRRAFSQSTVASLTKPGTTYNVRNKLIINGQSVDASSSETFDVHNPGTGEFITKVASAGVDDVNAAVAAAKAAGEEWSNTSPMQRNRLMLAYADKIEQHADELTTLECEDNGKPFDQAMSDVMGSAAFMRYYGGLAMNIEGTAAIRDNDPNYTNSYAYTRKEPIGVCALITPWNYPILMTALKVAPMLAAGCTGVSKPPELTPLSSLRLIELLHEVDGMPKGVVNCVPGIGSVAGEALVDHPDIRKITFTGSTAVGKRIMQRSAGSLKRVTLELGGKGPLIIFADGDIPKAIDTAITFGTINSGQFCAASSRIIVEESVYDQVVEGLAEAANNMSVGYWRESTARGPIISETQLSKILGYIEAGKNEGARLVAGGNRIDRPGQYIQPTVFADCTRDMKIVKEEIFGPVLSVMKFKSGEGSVEEALEIANESNYGLCGGFFTNDRQKANIISRKLECGQVGNNCYWGAGIDIPFGGYKESGLGREYSKYSLDSFLETKAVIVDCSTP